MHLGSLCRADLNLLVALQALLEEQSVSRASERLFVTQSAMSKTLQRLRLLFDDPLFTRHGQGMVPTSKALELQGQLAEVLQSAQSLISGKDFDPATYQGQFSIHVHESVGSVLFPPLMQILHVEAPAVSLVTKPESAEEFALLASGSIDFSLRVCPSDAANLLPSDQFFAELIGSKRRNIIVRSGHPLFASGSDLDWDRIGLYPQIRLASSERIDRTAAPPLTGIPTDPTIGRSAFETPHLFTALETVKQTDAVLIEALLLIDPTMAQGLDIRSVPEAIDDGTLFSCVLLGHKRTQNSLAHQWIRKLIGEVLGKYTRKADPAA